MMLYERCVDDSNQIAVVPSAGSRYDKERRKVVIDHIQLDTDIADDERLVD